MTDHRPPPSDLLPDDVVLRVRNVSKKFCRHLRRSMWYGIQDLGRSFVGMPSGRLVPDGGDGELDESEATDGHRVIGLRPHEFWASRDINLDLRRGDVLGLIGMNGCGKTTLLRLIAGIFPPDLGEIAIRGRTGALIALGAGFHPHMTGRENVYLNAAILGLTRQEICERFQAIIDFAEIGEFIDAPVSTYSSGMRVKLGFAISINVQADLLLIDEVLAVGDIGFKIKCMNAIRSLLKNTAVVFVSHSMQFISSFCTRVMVLEHGKVVCDTPSVSEGIDRYLSIFPTRQDTAGSGDAVIKNVVLSTSTESWGGDQEGSLQQNESLTVHFDLTITNPSIRRTRIVLQVDDQGMDPIICYQSSEEAGQSVYLSAGTSSVTIPLGKMDLNAGKYSLMISVSDLDSQLNLTRVQGLGAFRVLSNRLTWGRVCRDLNPKVERA